MTNLVRTTSSISFTQPTTFGKRHQSLPYSILCVFLWGLHQNITFPRDSQVSQNFGRSYHSQIKFFLKIQRQYFISLKKIFPTVYNMPNWSSFDPCFQGVCGRKSNWEFDFRPSFHQNSCKSCLNEQCEDTLNIYASKPF